MNQNLMDKTIQLKNKIESLPEVKKLEQLNRLLNEDEEVMRLCYKKDMASIKYEDAVRYYGEKSDEARFALKELHQAKLVLDENALVKSYNEQYKIVREIYEKINEEIFNPFN